MKSTFKVIIKILSLLLIASVGWSNDGLHLVVNQNHPNASNDNIGTESSPLETIGMAFLLVHNLAVEGETARIVVHEGVYRESIVWSDPEDCDFDLIIESYEDDEVVLSGSNVWTDWTDIGNDTYTHEWSYDWGIYSESEEWLNNPNREEAGVGIWMDSSSVLLQRREIVFINDERLDQVVDEVDMIPGSFFIDEENDLIKVIPSLGVNMEEANIEVAEDSMQLKIIISENIKIEGFTFQHTATPMWEGSLFVGNSKNVIIENCRFYNNSWAGLLIAYSEGVIVRNCVANDNGGLGMNCDHNKYFLMEDCETRLNNWRGDAAGTQCIALGGVKVLHMHNAVVRRHTSRDNMTFGFWFDNDNENILVRNCDFSNNEQSGLFFEKTHGPAYVQGCTIQNNDKAGVIFHSSDNLNINGNSIGGNLCQIMLWGYGFEWFNYETGEQYVGTNINHSVINNTFFANGPDQMLISHFTTPENWQTYLSSLTHYGNSFYPYEEEDEPMAPLAAGEDAVEVIPAEYKIVSTYPNPFNPTMTAVISLPQTSNLTVKVFNLIGRQVAVLANGYFESGCHSLMFDAGGLTSGTYFVHAIVPGKMNEIERVMLVK